jgi:hypothetical protein
MTTVCPAPSIVKFLSMAIVAASVIVPPQEKLMVSPAAAALICSTSRPAAPLGAVQSETTRVAAWAMGAGDSRLKISAISNRKRRVWVFMGVSPLP